MSLYSVWSLTVSVVCEEELCWLGSPLLHPPWLIAVLYMMGDEDDAKDLVNRMITLCATVKKSKL